MSVPPPSAPPRDDGPLNLRDVMAAGRGRERDELRSLRRTVQAVVVVIVAALVIAGLVVMAKSMNHETVARDCTTTAVTSADYEACVGDTR